MKKVLDILGIVLPFLLLLNGLFGKRQQNAAGKTSGRNGLVVSIALLLFLIGVIQYIFFSGSSSHDKGPKPVPLPVSKHSDAFNISLENVLATYYQMEEGFVNDDTSAINRTATDLQLALDSLKMDELKKDTIIYETALDPLANAKGEVLSIIKDPSMTEKRGSLNTLSDLLKTFLIVVRYDRAKIYWQECPVAFGTDKPGNWLSSSIDVRNPYPMKDPDGAAMTKCGGPKDTINFMVADTTKK